MYIKEGNRTSWIVYMCACIQLYIYACFPQEEHNIAVTVPHMQNLYSIYPYSIPVSVLELESAISFSFLLCII